MQSLARWIERGQIGCEAAQGWWRALAEVHGGGAAAGRFEAEAARAGTDIGDAQTIEPLAELVEEALCNAVSQRPGGQSGRSLDPATTPAAADDAQASGSC